MIKKFLIVSLYAAITFCIVSYISVMYSLLQSVGKLHLKPVTNIGFPFKYYYQFWLSGSNSPNCGWDITYFIYDVVIVWGIIAAFFILKIKYLKK